MQVGKHWFGIWGNTNLDQLTAKNMNLAFILGILKLDQHRKHYSFQFACNILQQF